MGDSSLQKPFDRLALVSLSMTRLHSQLYRSDTCDTQG